MRAPWFAILAVGCAGPSGHDVVGPFTGETRHFVVDAIHLPATIPEARLVGDDLTGDGVVDNQFGDTVVTLAEQNDVTTHGADMIAAGAIASTVDIQADDFSDDPTVSVTYVGVAGTPSI